jgi:hypothetical protein
MEIESKQPFDPAQAKQILERRKEIEQELVDMLKETEAILLWIMFGMLFFMKRTTTI